MCVYRIYIKRKLAVTSGCSLECVKEGRQKKPKAKTNNWFNFLKANVAQLFT